MGFFANRLGFRRSSTTQTNDPALTAITSLSNSGDSVEKDKVISSGQQLPEEIAVEAQKKLHNLQRKHRWDPNLPSDTLEDLDEAVHVHDFKQDVNLVGAFEDNSPYPEVCAAVRNVSIAIPESARNSSLI